MTVEIGYLGMQTQELLSAFLSSEQQLAVTEEWLGLLKVARSRATRHARVHGSRMR